MAPSTPSVQPSFNLRSVLEKEKLNGTNFMDWYRTLRIVLKQEKKEYVLDAPLPEPPADGANKATRDAYQTHLDDTLNVSCLMLLSMSSELQKQHENMDAYDMIMSLKSMFENQARIERYKMSKILFASKLAEGEPVSPHVINMIGRIESLGKMGFTINGELAVDLILQSLPDSYDPFILNYHMNSMNKSLQELHGMLKTADGSLKKPPNHVMMVQKKPKFKKSSKMVKGKKCKNTDDKPKAKAESPAKESECFYCKEKGHWKRNCKKYLASKKNGSETSGPGITINVIEINLATSNVSAWVFDTGSVAHICNTMQGLTRSRRLAKGEVDIRVGNKARVAAFSVGVYSLQLPSGLIMELDNCYFVPSLSRNIISSSCLEQDGFDCRIKDMGCSIYRNNMFYCRCPVVNGLYVLNLEELPIYNISNKKHRLNDSNPTY
jgi:hypothetical protein